HAVGDPQPVAFDEPLDGEGDRHQEDGDAGGQTRDLDQQVGRLPGALGDVLFQARGGAVGERGDRQQHHHGEHAHQEPHEVRRAVHARGEQRFVALHLVDVHRVGIHGVGAARAVPARGVLLPGAGAGAGAGGVPAVGVPVVGVRSLLATGATGAMVAGVRSVPVTGLRAVRAGVRAVRARRSARGAFRVPGVRTLLLHRLFLISYHQSPPARWWHAEPAQGGIRVHLRGRTVCPKGLRRARRTHARERLPLSVGWCRMGRMSQESLPSGTGPEPADALPEYAERVLDVADLIPPGRVMTYGDVAEWLGEGGPRQVGRVMALYGGAVPWWRVVR